MNSTNVITEIQSRQQIRAAEVKRIAGYANAVTALLETFCMLSDKDQAHIIAVAGSIASDVARDLVSLSGGAV